MFKNLLFIGILLLPFFAFTQDVSTSESESADVPFAIIDKAPIYPGCKGDDDNKTLKKCMSENISAFVASNFNLKLIESLELPPKRYRIAVQFKIDKRGNVVDVYARADHPKIEEEAIRVVSSLPKFTPGEHRGKTIGVLYALPILFEVEAKTINKRDKKSREKTTKSL